jgi:hypothetical protein
MNPEITNLQIDWETNCQLLRDSMKSERALINEITQRLDSVRQLERKIETFEADLVVRNTGKEMFINGSNDQTRKVQMATFLERERQVNPELMKLFDDTNEARLALASSEGMRESLKDTIEIARITVSHVDAVLRALATP